MSTEERWDEAMELLTRLTLQMRELRKECLEDDEDPSEPVDPPVDPEPPVNSEPIGPFLFGASDDYPGKMYFITNKNLDSLMIGGGTYKYHGRYKGQRYLWYGTTSGKILGYGKNGVLYTGETEGAIDPIDPPGPGEEYTLKYYKLTNGDRPTYYSSGGKLKAGDVVEFKVGSVHKRATVKPRKGTVGYEWPDRTVITNSHVSGRTIAVLIPARYKNDPPGRGWLKVK